MVRLIDKLTDSERHDLALRQARPSAAWRQEFAKFRSRLPIANPVASALDVSEILATIDTVMRSDDDEIEMMAVEMADKAKDGA
jgi:hypothetical protein